MYVGTFMVFQDHRDGGFTGLEAAIVLIAFVVVAAVFSYVVLGVGFFTTQKAQAVVFSGVGQASSTLQVGSTVYGATSGTTGDIRFINFSVSLGPGGSAMDFSKTVIVYSNQTELITLDRQTSVPGQPGPNGWAITKIQNAPNTVSESNALLQPGEQFDISAKITPGVIPNDRFTIEIHPSIGAPISLTRTTPAIITPITMLY